MSKILLISAVAMLPSIIIPVAAHAADADLILLRLEKALRELEGVAKITRRISPVGATSCVISGFCLSQELP